MYELQATRKEMCSRKYKIEHWFKQILQWITSTEIWRHYKWRRVTKKDKTYIQEYSLAGCCAESNDMTLKHRTCCCKCLKLPRHCRYWVHAHTMGHTLLLSPLSTLSLHDGRRSWTKPSSFVFVGILLEGMVVVVAVIVAVIDVELPVGMTTGCCGNQVSKWMM